MLRTTQITGEPESNFDLPSDPFWGLDDLPQELADGVRKGTHRLEVHNPSFKRRVVPVTAPPEPKADPMPAEPDIPPPRPSEPRESSPEPSPAPAKVQEAKASDPKAWDWKRVRAWLIAVNQHSESTAARRALAGLIGMHAGGDGTFFTGSTTLARESGLNDRSRTQIEDDRTWLAEAGFIANTGRTKGRAIVWALTEPM